MDVFLLSIGLEGDVLLYADILEELGVTTPDDLLLVEPSLEYLEEIGIDLPGDRDKIYALTHPELCPTPSSATDYSSSEIIHQLAEPSYGFDPLSYEVAKNAILQANVEKFKDAITSSNFDVNMQDPLDHRNTLLHWAVTYKHPLIIQILLEKGATGLLPNEFDKTPVELAMEAYARGDSSYQDIVTMLAEHTRKQLGL